MAKFIFATDLHMHPFVDFSQADGEYITTRFKEQIRALENVFSIARKEKAKVIIGGDVFHKRGAIKTEVFNKVFKVFQENGDIESHILRGNHDSTTNSLRTHSSITPLKALPNVHVYNTPKRHSIDGVGFYFLPYGDETEEMKEFINSGDKVDSSDIEVLVAHIGVDGASQGKHSHRLSGAFGYGDLRPDYFNFILLGHYHKRQQLSTDHNRHFYGGSYMQHNFGDEGQDKGVHLIDTEANTVEFIPLETTKFVTVQGNDVPSNLEEVMKNSFVRFLGSANEVKALQNLQEANKELGLDNIRIELQRDYTQEARMGLNASMSEEDIVRKFAQDKFPGSVDEALECLREAR